jgi:ABC-type transport system involved in cytochrome c biogenesis permease subunit
MKTQVLSLLVILGSALSAPAQQAETDPPSGPPALERPATRTQPWTPRTLELADRLAIQEGGRVKPMSTFAGFALLRFHGKRTLKISEDEKIGPTEWLLDVLFDPAAAEEYPVFLVQDSHVIEAIGLSTEGKRRRDRYSFAELQEGIPRLMNLAHQYDRIEPKERTSLQAQVVNLAENVLALQRINRLETLYLVPPATVGKESEHEGWWSPAELTAMLDSGRELPGEHARLLESFQRLGELRNDPAGFERELAAFGQGTTALARARGEGGKVDTEVAYYRSKLITRSLVAFLLAFLAACGIWLKPKSRWLYRLCAGVTAFGTLLLVAAITWRCIIRGRPPVSTLYETVLFVTAVGAIVALVGEWIQRSRVALSAAAVLGTVGLFVANGYETMDKKDTMPSLVAVLDTNFWLATHVTTITIGYAGGMLAALLGSIYLLGKLFGLRRSDPSFYRSLGRTVYGVLCFSVIFSTVGTILGGIWANDSWGRFWGWDPKENGALLIVLSQLVILHARMGGYLREHGLCMAAAFGGTVVAFSWWGVNLLGVGLHSYGFTSGIARALWIYYGLQWGTVALGGLAWLLERRRAESAVAASTHAAARPGEPQPPSRRASPSLTPG